MHDTSPARAAHGSDTTRGTSAAWNANRLRPRMRAALDGGALFAACLVVMVAVAPSTASALTFPTGTVTVNANRGPGDCNSAPCSREQIYLLGSGIFGTHLSTSVHGNVEWNNARASVALVNTTDRGPLSPFMPGTAALELGVYASVASGFQLTVSGLPGLDINNPLFRVVASAQATYSDHITFSDASLPLGAPIQVSLSYYLTNSCGSSGGGSGGGGGGGGVGGPSCTTQDRPEFFVGVADAVASPYSATVLTSRIGLPGGVDEARSENIETQAGIGGASAGPGYIGNLLTHNFTVANGDALDYSVSALATLTFDGQDLLSPSGGESQGKVIGWRKLDYENTMHVGAITGMDALGNALPGLQLQNGLGWTLAAVALPVPEPTSALMLALGLGVLLLRHARA